MGKVVCKSGEGDGTPLQYSCLETPMEGGAWWAAVQGVAKSRTRLSDFTFTFYFHVLEKEMATHSRVLAWRIPGTEEPVGLPSMGSHRVGHDWSDLAAAAAVCKRKLAFCAEVPRFFNKVYKSSCGDWARSEGLRLLQQQVFSHPLDARWERTSVRVSSNTM